MKKHVVCLTNEERGQLTELIRKGKAAAYKIRHAHILLKADVDGPAWSDDQIGEAFSVHTKTVGSLRQRFVKQGLEAVLNRKKRARPPRKRKLDGEAEARLIALSCGKPPEGYNRWTLRLLADKAVELEIVDTISYETVRRTLKKRAEAAFVQIVGDPSGAECGVRGPNGGCPGHVSPAIRSADSVGVHG